MSFNEFISKYAKATGRTREEAKKVCNEIYAMIVEAVMADEPLEIYGFGTLETYIRDGRTVKGMDGKIYDVKPKRTLRFRPGAAFERKLNEGA